MGTSMIWDLDMIYKTLSGLFQPSDQVIRKAQEQSFHKIDIVFFDEDIILYSYTQSHCEFRAGIKIQNINNDIQQIKIFVFHESLSVTQL